MYNTVNTAKQVLLTMYRVLRIYHGCITPKIFSMRT